MTPPDDLVEAIATVRDRLGSFGENLLYYDLVGSTNDVANRLALAGAAEGTVVVSGAQSSGRGRMGHTWFSPAGVGLYVSVVIRPDAAQPMALFTLMAGVALAEALRLATGLPVEIKWPNDLVVEGRKICGILAEGHMVHGSLLHVVVGFGINVRVTTYPPEIARRATSIEAELGHRVERGVVLASALASLAHQYERLRASQFDAILTQWRSLAPSSTGASVEWTAAEGVRGGVTAGIDDDGALCVRVGEHIERITAGEVRWS